MRLRRSFIALGIVACLILSSLIYRSVFEVEILLERGHYAGRRMYSNFDPGTARRVVDLFRRPLNDDWQQERDRVLDELMTDHGFVKRIGMISTNRFRGFFINMGDDEKEQRLLAFSYSPHTNAPRREIYFIGPQDLVEKTMAGLELLESDENAARHDQGTAE
jgi:hypothetical protein